MLRIAPPTKTAPPPAPDPAQPDPTEAAADPTQDPSSESMSQQYDADKLDPAKVCYLGPDAVCGACSYFDGQSSCHIVSGKIDATFHCNLFSPAEQGADGDEPPQPADASQEPGDEAIQA